MREISVTVNFTLKQHAMFQNPKRIQMIAIDCFSGYYGSNLNEMVKQAERLRDAMHTATSDHLTGGDVYTCTVIWTKELLESLENARIVELVYEDNKSAVVRFLWNR